MTYSTQHSDKDAGFTLVEVLVSMFIFSLISVGALIALSTTLDAREAAETRLNEIEQLAAARRLMADDFAAMIIRQNRDGLGGFVDETRKVTRMDGFELTRRARRNPDGVFPRGDLLRIAYRVENGALIRSFIPHENPAFDKSSIDRMVLNRVEAMQVVPILNGRHLDSIVVPLDRTDAVSIILTHVDSTTTRHMFEISTDG